jgi:hypothetical protein
LDSLGGNLPAVTRPALLSAQTLVWRKRGRHIWGSTYIMMMKQGSQETVASFLGGFLYLFVIAVLVVFVGNSGIPYPKDNHFFVAILPHIDSFDREINAAYGLIRSPVYNLIDWIFWNPLAYFIASVLMLFTIVSTFHY